MAGIRLELVSSMNIHDGDPMDRERSFTFDTRRDVKRDDVTFETLNERLKANPSRRTIRNRGRVTRMKNLLRTRPEESCGNARARRDSFERATRGSFRYSCCRRPFGARARARVSRCFIRRHRIRQQVPVRATSLAIRMD